MIRRASRRKDGEARLPDPRRRYHFHLPGLLYVVVTVFLALGAFNSQNNLLFWSLGLAFAGLIVSGVVSGSALMGIRVTREAVMPTDVGEPMRVRYVVSNTNRFMPAFALHVEESTEFGRAGFEPTWQDHMETPRALAVHAGPRERVVVAGQVTPTHRGEARFSAIRVWTTFPFGITRKSVTFFEEGTAIVRPRRPSLRPSLVESIRGRRDAGRETEAAPGLGEEFFGLREYVPGDPHRMIAWRPTARLGQLVVRTNTAPTPRRLWVVLRLRPDGEEEMDERGISVSASLATMAMRQGNAVGLSVPVAGILISPRSGARHLDRMLNELGRLDVEAARRSGQPDRFPAAAAHEGGCVVVHAGALDPSWGSRRARHVSVRAMDTLLASERPEVGEASAGEAA